MMVILLVQALTSEVLDTNELNDRSEHTLDVSLAASSESYSYRFLPLWRYNISTVFFKYYIQANNNKLPNKNSNNICKAKKS